jgi:molecular chaperone GrpE
VKPHDPFDPRHERPPDDDEVEILEVVGIDLDDEGPDRQAPREDEPHEVAPAFDDEAAPARGERPAALLERLPREGEDRLSDREQLKIMRADYENLLKRLERERQDYEQYANSSLVSRLLPVLDNFQRALSAGEDSAGGVAFRRGIELIYHHLLDELRKEGLEGIEALGRHFDPVLHDAVATAAAPPQHDNVVVEELQRGWVFRSRILRPALVKVGLAGSSGDAPASGGGA